MSDKEYQFCILGAGPAGLGTAWELAKRGERDVIVIDRNKQVGGLARTEDFDGNLFDVGPHRFFTKNREVNALWHGLLGNDFAPVSRLTRVQYGGKLYRYPISAGDALAKLGPIEATHSMISYMTAKLTRNADKAETFEEWISARFGDKLYRTFFKTYTEKVWGIPCTEIGADWAAQRIKGLDLVAVLKNSLGIGRGKVKTLVDQFDYPTKGAGMMYERMAEFAAGEGHEFLLGAEVIRIEREGERLKAAVVKTSDGEERRVSADQFVSTIPITHFVNALSPAVDDDVRAASDALYYRDHITVNLVVEGDDLFPDQWIYVHSPDVRMARLANYNNFSKAMRARPGTTLVSIEYFVFQDDDIWSMSDDELRAFGTDEIERMKLIPKGAAQQGWVVRETESYPTYYMGFQEPFDKVRGAVDALSNCTPAGRGGMYKYNNMDHSLYTGLLAARNLLASDEQYNLWQVNIDAEYLEAAEISSETTM